MRPGLLASVDHFRNRAEYYSQEIDYITLTRVIQGGDGGTDNITNGTTLWLGMRRSKIWTEGWGKGGERKDERVGEGNDDMAPRRNPSKRVY